MDNQLQWNATSSLTRTFLRYLRSYDHPGKLRLVRNFLSFFYRQGFVLKAGNGALIQVDEKDFIGWALLKDGAYEPQTLSRAATLLKDGGVFVDVGANVGLFTTFLGVLPAVHCLSIEPDPANFIRLRRNVLLCGLVNCKLINAAIGSSARLLDLEEINSKNTGTVRVQSNDTLSSGNCITVSAISFDDLFAHAGVDGIVLLKIDIEGYELPALNGLDWHGKYRPQHVLIEFSDYGDRFSGTGRADILKFFTDMNYSGYSVAGESLLVGDDPIEHNAWFIDRERSTAPT